MGSQEVISGNLQVLKNGLIKSNWQNRWCVLYDSSSDGARLEYFDSQDGASRQSTSKKVIPLEKISRIEKLQPKANSFPFDITVKGNKLSFQARTAADCESWTQAFYHLMNQMQGLPATPTPASPDPGGDSLVDNVLYETTELVTKFPVTLSESTSEAAENQELVGNNYQLAVGRLGYELFDATGKNSLQHWPFRHVRKFGATAEHFILHGGSRCGEWMGEFKFLTPEGQAIRGAVDRMTKLLAPNANPAPTPAPPAAQPEAPPPVKEKPSTQRKGSTSEAGEASTRQEAHLAGGGREPVLVLPAAGGSLRGKSANYLAELDDKLYEFTKGHPELDFRHPKHQEKMQAKVSTQAAPGSPGSPAPAAAQPAASNPSKAPLQPAISNSPAEPDDQKSQTLSRGQSSDYEKAQKKKTKEEKKREEKERKEQEKRAKEQKEQEKKEEKKRKSREKSRSKHGSTNKATPPPEPDNTYEEVDIQEAAAPASKQPQALENEYSEANFRPQPSKPVRNHIYSEPDVDPSSATPAAPSQTVYSQVVKSRSGAWKEFGRSEDNLHEEDYDRIKTAAMEAEKTRPDQEHLPPSLPSADDEDDETYDSLALPSLNKEKPQSKMGDSDENLYGMASAVPAMSSRLSSADAESGYEEAESISAAAAGFQRKRNYVPSHDYEEADFGSPPGSGNEEEEDLYTQAT